MATVYAHSSDFLMPFGRGLAEVDLSAAAADTTTLFIVPTAWVGELDINRCFFWATEAVGDATTEGVVTIVHTPSGGSATTIGTFTGAQQAVNTCTAFTPAAGYEKCIKLGAGDTILVDHTVQASGGTTTGAGYVFLAGYIVPLAR